MISWIDCIGPYGMAGAIKVMDPFQWAVQTPRELAEDAERRRNREEHGLSQLDSEIPRDRCIDCGSDMHGTDHPSCPEQHDCED